MTNTAGETAEDNMFISKKLARQYAEKNWKIIDTYHAYGRTYTIIKMCTIEEFLVCENLNPENGFSDYRYGTFKELYEALDFILWKIDSIDSQKTE